MNKLFRYLLFSIALFSFRLTHAFAILSPSELVETASRSRIDFIESVSSTERLIHQVRSKDEVFAYLMVLPRLEELAKGFELENLGGSPLPTFASSVSTAAVKWSDIRTDSVESHLLLLRWATPNIRYEFVNTQFRNVSFITEKEKFFEIYHNWGTLVGYLIELKSESLVVIRFQEFHATILNKLLAARLTLTHNEIKDLIVSSYDYSAFQEILNFLQSQVYSSSDLNVVKSRMYLAMLVNERMRNEAIPTPAHLQSLPSQIVAEAIVKIVRNGGALDSPSLNSAMAVMNATQTDQVGAMLTSLVPDVYAVSQLDFVSDLAVRVVDFYDRHSMLKQKEDLKKILGKIMIRKQVAIKKVEGSFGIMMDGEYYTMTILRTSPSEMVIGLSSDFLSYSMYNTYYNRERDQFEASRFDLSDGSAFPSSVNQKNYAINFQISADGQDIEGSFSTGGALLHFTGEREGDYVDYIATPHTTREDLNGSYFGTLDNQRLHDARLVLTAVGEHVTGTLAFNVDDQPMSVAFSMGYYNLRNNTIYLTSGETSNGNHIQLRGRILNGRFEGQYIIGGDGKVINMNLVRSAR